MWGHQMLYSLPAKQIGLLVGLVNPSKVYLYGYNPSK